jgi:hypothetical protein
MTEAWHETIAKVPEVFSTEQREVRARRTKLVQRAATITGKLFLALAAKAARAPAAVNPAKPPRPVPSSAAAARRGGHPRARRVAQLPTVGTRCADGRFAAFGRGHIVDSPGCGLPESLHAEVPGAGGRGSQAGAGRVS